MFEALIDRIEHDERLGPVAEKIKSVVGPVIGEGVVRDALTGRFLGHPAHPMIVVAPLTGWFAGTILDVVGGPAARRPAQTLIGLGTFAALPSAMSGAADWLYTSEAEERVGTVHAALADSATVLFATSWLLRSRRHHRAAVTVGLLGASMAGATAFVGGHLSFRRGVGVPTTAYQAGPTDWTVLELDEEPTTERAVRGVADGLPFAVVAATGEDGGVHVMESRCTHRGGPLHEGVVVDGCLECPWHGARFDLATGAVRKGPAVAPQPRYDVVIADGVTKIERDEAGGLRVESTTV